MSLDSSFYKDNLLIHVLIFFNFCLCNILNTAGKLSFRGTLLWVLILFRLWFFETTSLDRDSLFCSFVLVRQLQHYNMGLRNIIRGNSISFLSLCVHVSMSLCVHMCGALRPVSGVLLHHWLPVFWDSVSHWTCSLLIELCRLASKPQGVFCLPSSGKVHATVPRFLHDSKDRTQVIMHGKHFTDGVIVQTPGGIASKVDWRS